MDIKDQFPTLENTIYVNTPTSCLLAKDVLNWRRQHDEEFFQRGYAFRDQFEKFLIDVKQTVADFFHAAPHRTYLLPNFSFGFNTILDRLPADERFLLLQEDYPSVNYAVESRGFSCDYVQISATLEEDILAKIASFKPTVFAFSLVQYISGVKLDLHFIKKLKQLYPDMLLLADGTQYCGTAAFDFGSSGLDALGASAYKWMMAGYGAGFLLLSEGLRGRLFAAINTTSSPKEPFLKDKDLLSLFFEPGHQDTLTFGSLQQGILLLNKVGIHKIEAHIRSLSTKAKLAFAEKGLLADKVIKRAEHSSIFNLSIDPSVYQRLQNAGVVCVPRGNGIRIGFHFFNTEDDLSQILDLLDEGAK